MISNEVVQLLTRLRKRRESEPVKPVRLGEAFVQEHRRQNLARRWWPQWFREE